MYKKSLLSCIAVILFSTHFNAYADNVLKATDGKTTPATKGGSYDALEATSGAKSTAKI